MQKQLVLAALFAAVKAQTACVDANTRLADAAKTAAEAIKAAPLAEGGLDAVLVATTAALGTATTAWTTASGEEQAWITALATWTAAKAAANTAVTDTAAALATASSAKSAADDAVSQPSPALAAAINADVAGAAQTARTADTAAKGVVDVMVTQKANVTAIKEKKEALQAAQKILWDAERKTLTNRDLEVTAELAKFDVGNLSIYTMGTGFNYTGATESMKASTCLAGSTLGDGTIWNGGTNCAKCVGGLAATAGTAAEKLSSSAFYAANYTNCANVGYAALHTAAAATSKSVDGTKFVTWKDAQKALEAKAYVFGKLKQVCMSRTNYGAGGVATPCLRNGAFESLYMMNFPGVQSPGGAATVRDATFAGAAFDGAVTAVTLVGKLGDYAADGAVTVDGALVAGPLKATAQAEYVAAVTLRAANGADGTELFSTRDVAYKAWLTDVHATAAAKILLTKAVLESARLGVLGTTYVSATAAASQPADSQAKVYKTAVEAVTTQETALGKVTDKTANPSAATANVVKTSADMTTLLAALVTKGEASTSTLTMAADPTILTATTATKSYLESAFAVGAAKAREAQAVLDLASANAAKVLTAAVVTENARKVTIAAYLRKIQEDTRVTNEAAWVLATDAKNAADRRVTSMRKDKTQTIVTDTTTAMITAGAAPNDEVDERKTFFAKVTAAALAAKNVAKGLDDAAKEAVAQNTRDLQVFAAAVLAPADAVAAEKPEGRLITAVKRALDNCKKNGYEVAQAARKRIDDDKTADDAAAAALKTSYAVKTKAARPASAETASPAGSDCSYPAAVDGVQGPRPVCAEEHCCGAANKFLKDGTKLTMETCQKADAVSYTFYPELKAGATVEPATEQWRFSCISGAKNLAATAAAALAAAYLMA